MNGDTRRILVITLSNIGDAVMTTPVLEALQHRYPDARLDVVADRRSGELFAHCPYVERILYKEKRAGWRGTLRLVRELRRRRYDLVVDLRTDGLAYLLRARRRLTKWRRGPHGPHAVEQHMAVIAPLGVCEIPATRLWLDARLEADAATLLQPLPGERWLALGPGANWEPKIWPPTRFREFAEQLQDSFDAVVLLGGPNDAERCTFLSHALPLPTLNLAGRTSLLQAAAVLARMRAFVGNDSGLGHIASAVGTPTLTLFGPGEPERYHPWGPRVRWVVGRDRDLNRLSVDEVIHALESLLVP